MTDLRPLYRAGAAGAAVQLSSIAVLIAVMVTLGDKPADAAGWFAAYADHPAKLVLIGDFPILLMMVAPYLVLGPALAAALRDRAPLLAPFLALMTIAGAIGAFAVEETFSMLHLAGRFAEATSEAERTMLLTAGETVIAMDLWHSTAAYMGGILLQGPGVVFSWLMWRHNGFSKVTAVAGVLGNGLDLAQHLVHPFAPELGEAIKSVMGFPYLIWFPAMAWDLWRLGRGPGAT